MYLLNVVIFNEIHLRRKNERMGWVLLYVYYLPYKIILTGINVASCYWSLYKYARYFAKRHPKVVEDEKAVEVIIRLEEETAAAKYGIGRRMTVRTIGTRSQVDVHDDRAVSPSAISPMQRVDTRVSLMVRTPEAAHVRAGNQVLSTPAMEREGIAGGDYFFDQAGRGPEYDTVDVEKG